MKPFVNYCTDLEASADVIDDITRVKDDPRQPVEGERRHDDQDVLGRGHKRGQLIQRVLKDKDLL